MTLVDMAFIQVDPYSGWPINETAFSLFSGCQSLGIETRPFTFLRDITPTRETLVHGWVSNVKQALHNLGAQEPSVPDVPEELLHLFGRDIWTITLKEFRNRRSSVPLFIKPLRATKAFTGHISSGTIQDLILLNTFPDDMELLVSEPVDFVAEYRVLVHHGLMFACRHYKGDFTIQPDLGVALEAIQRFTGAPVGYAIDLGATSEGKTVIVEINDAYALGSYGAPSIPYTQMVIDRWVEMTQAT